MLRGLPLCLLIRFSASAWSLVSEDILRLAQSCTVKIKTSSGRAYLDYIEDRMPIRCLAPLENQPG